MKLTTFLLVAVYLHVSAAGFGQKVNISGKDLPLKKVFSMIMTQTGYSCFYTDDLLQGTKDVTLDLKDAGIEEAMKVCLKDENLDFSITNRMIFIKKRAETKIDASGSGPGRTIKASGVVYNESGQPLSGANVVIKETGKGTLTNAKGEFSFVSVPVNSVLVISYVGYKNQQVAIKEDVPVQVRLTIAVNELDVQVVQAYGKTSQRLTTSNIGRVTAEEIEKQPVMNPLLALQGKVAGLDIVQTSGYASAPVKVELRGRSAINSQFTSDPLYIIDGVPLTVLEIGGNSSYQTGSTGFLQNPGGFNGPANGQSPFFSVNPSDIESVEILKDADATAIYGSRGANGVILITTKRGKAGKTQFDGRIQEGISKQTRFWKMLNTQQYLNMRREALKNDGIIPSLSNGDYDLLEWDTTRYTDWQRQLYGGTGKSLDAEASLSGGNAQTIFRIGAGYNRVTNILTVSGADQRGSFSFNLGHRSLDQRLSVSFSTIYSVAQSDMISVPGAVTLAPNAPSIFDSAGNLNYAGWGKNNSSARQLYPFSSLMQPYKSNINFLNSHLTFDYQPVKGLHISSGFGYNNGQQNNSSYTLIASQDPLSNPKGSSNLGYTNNKNWILEPQATYDAFIGKGRVAVLLGGSIQQAITSGIGTSGYGFTSDVLIRSIANALSKGTSDNYGQYRYAALFGRVTYNWENRYILNLNARRDGSSRFGENNQFGNFASLGAAWIFTEEGWFKRNMHFLSFGKIRGSYGTTGSDGVGDYKYLTRWASIGGVQPYDNISPLAPLQHANPNFHWQINKKLEGGLDLGFLKDRINLQIVYYRDRCGNQLVNFPTPAFTGFVNVTANSPALVQNEGLEFSLNAKIIHEKHFELSVSFNTAINRNKLISYPNIQQSPYASTLVVGKPLNLIHLLHYTGVDPQTGEYTFEDRNHNGIIELYAGQPGDDTYYRDLSPKFFGGLGMNFTCHNLKLDLFFYFKKQIGGNALLQGESTPGSIGNQPVTYLGKEWKKPGDIASIARYTTQGLNSYNQFASSDGVYTDASYIRLSNLSFSYSLPVSYIKKIGMQGCSIFFNTNNLLTITKYKGLDPETQNFGGMPPAKILVGGVSFNF